MRSSLVSFAMLVLLASTALAACNKKPAEPEQEKAEKKEVAPKEAIRRGAIKGTIGKPLVEVSMRDMQAAIKAAGWVAAGYTEAKSGGTTTRNFPVSRGRNTGAVTWYQTNDKDMVQSTVIQGWPSAEDGECIVAVHLSDEGRREDARRLLTALVGD